MNIKRFVSAMLVLGALSVSALEMPTFFNDNMILQRETSVPVWGKAPAGQKVTVTFAGNSASTVTGADGKWRVNLPAMPASSEGRELKIVADTNLTLKNVVVGDIWLCAGQSNMAYGLLGLTDGRKMKDAANHPNIRLLHVEMLWSRYPAEDFRSLKPKRTIEWHVCETKHAWRFSGVGYLTGKELHETLNVPIGLVNVSWGGCRVESMSSLESFHQFDTLKEVAARNVKLVADMQAKNEKGEWVKNDEQLGKERNRHQRIHTALYNAMVHPMSPMAVKGMLWYQGEDNHYEGAIYGEKLKALAWTWRKNFENPDMPIYIVLLPPFKYNMKAPYTKLSDRLPIFLTAQKKFAETDKHSGFIVTTDSGNTEDIHPREKRPLASRLAKLVLYKTYGIGDSSALAPTFKEAAFAGNKATVTFNNANGLKTTDGKAPSFVMLAGADGKFVPADETSLVNEQLVATSKTISDVKAISFGWNNIAAPNVVNRAGHPVMPFNSLKK